MATKLKRLRIDEISLVDKGANQHAFITLFKRDVPEIETPRDSDRNFNATGAGPATDRLWESFDDRRRGLGPAQGQRAFADAWNALSDAERNEIRNEEARTEQAREAAAAAAEAERKKEMMKQMDNSNLQEIIKLAGDIDAGRMSGNFATKSQWYQALSKLAESEREPNETREMAFARVINEDAGKLLFKAYRNSAGSDYVPPAPEAAPVIKSDSAYARLKKIAADLCAETPGLTSSAAFVKVFTDPANRELAELSKRESAFA
jgi:hypothetical protein